jgi:phosphoenolpyruvate carboxykinase (GTP)
MADYFGHWLEMGRRHPDKMPRVFLVNWFRKDENGKFIWPGFGENSRVLEWIFRRCERGGETVETPLGLVPAPGDLDTQGLDLAPDDLQQLLEVDPELVRDQLPQVEEHLARFGDRLPDEIGAQLESLRHRLGA